MTRSLILLFIVNLTFAQAPLTSGRSRAVTERVTPLVEQQFETAGLSLGSPLFMRIFKEEMVLELWVYEDSTYHLFKSYPISTYGRQGLGPKTRRGDGFAPEGFYFVSASSMNPSSRFHLSFNLGYPNSYDRAHGRTGSALMVHGSTVSIGCFAMTNPQIEEIYTIAEAALVGGQPFFRVHIFPFRMNDSRLELEQLSSWYPFWLNLQQGYLWFETHGREPNVTVRNRTYVFE